MIDRKNVKIVLIILGMTDIILLYAGILSGLHQDWMRMSIFLFVSVLLIFFCTSALLALKLDKFISRLEDLISKKLNSDQPEN